uniref:Uncharacterized protein n=1 Tax=Rhizophora mucronata TaxID=61149 RepID=A0A2P2PZZ3_RHIMU
MISTRDKSFYQKYKKDHNNNLDSQVIYSINVSCTLLPCLIKQSKC